MLNKIRETEDNILKSLPVIEELAKEIAEKIDSNGKVIFVGAGISSETARIIIDELWFNFQIKRGKFVALTAAKQYTDNLEKWKELEEMSSTSIFELNELGIDENDIVIGLSSSGKTQYVVSAVKYAKDLGCKTAVITDVDSSFVAEYADYVINTKFGKPSIKGLNAAEGGTVQKIIIDLLIYNAMAFAGRIYENTLVFMIPVSKKIEDYCLEVITELLLVDLETANELFNKYSKSLELTIICEKLNIDISKAKSLLLKYNNNLNKIL